MEFSINSNYKNKFNKKKKSSQEIRTQTNKYPSHLCVQKDKIYLYAIKKDTHKTYLYIDH